MQTVKTLNTAFINRGSFGFLVPGVVMMAAAALGCLLLIAADTEWSGVQNFYLLPWVALVAAVIAAPCLYLWQRGQLNFVHPLVYAAWSFFVPAFVGGGLVLASGLSAPFYLHFIENPEYNLPLTLVYIALGFAGLTLGYLLPYAKQIGAAFSKRLPKWDWDSSEVLAPGVILLGIGAAFYLSAWFAGAVGYQQFATDNAFGGTQFFLSLLFLEAFFLICIAVFKASRLDANYFLAAAAGLAMIPLRVVIGGGRANLLQIFIIGVFAFVLAGKRIKAKQTAVIVVVGTLVVLVGMIYGTTFREVKGSEERTGLVEYLESAATAVDRIGGQDAARTVGKAAADFAERIEVVSPLAVVVANYEKLAPYEAAYGLDNNIWTYTWTAFIPRFVWPDKPLVSDARSYSDLYFNYNESSFAITPVGDLLRNFGPLGIPLGMMLLGFVLRVTYVALIEDQPITIGRAALFYMLATSVSYEGFYGSILPVFVRTGVVALVSLIAVDFFINASRRS